MPEGEEVAVQVAGRAHTVVDVHVVVVQEGEAAACSEADERLSEREGRVAAHWLW